MNRPITLLAVLVFCAVSSLLPSCLSPKVSDVALFRPAAATWPKVERDYLRGVTRLGETGEASGVDVQGLRSDAADMRAALAAGDRGLLRLVPWFQMRPYVDLGIRDMLEDGEIGPGAAESLTNRLAEFDQTIRRLQGN